MTLVSIEYAGFEAESDRLIGGGGAINAEQPFDYVIESNGAISYKGVYQYLSGAKPARIALEWSANIYIHINEDLQRGVADVILPVAGDVLIGSASSIGVNADGPPQCLMEIGGHLNMHPGSHLYLTGFSYDPTDPDIPPAKYPLLLMKGGPTSTIQIDRPTEIIIQSQQTMQDWRRCIGFLEDGAIKFSAYQMSMTTRNPGNPEHEIVYEAANKGLITIEAHIKGGVDGLTQSLTYQTEGNAPIMGGTINETSINFKNITCIKLACDRNLLALNSDVYVKQNDPFVEPETGRQSVGNLPQNENPLFEDAPRGDFRLKKESPLIDAGNTQYYNNFINRYLLADGNDIAGNTQIVGGVNDIAGNARIIGGVNDIAGNTRIIGGAIDIGAYEYDPSDTGNEPRTIPQDDIALWTQQGKLFIHSEKPVRVSLYTVSGRLIRQLNLKSYETIALPLERGVYFVVPNSGLTLKVLVW